MTKNKKIGYIRRIIDRYGSFTPSDIHNEPIIILVDGKPMNLVQFDIDSIMFAPMQDADDEDVLYYTKMNEELLDEMMYHVEIYEATALQTEKRISN